MSAPALPQLFAAMILAFNVLSRAVASSLVLLVTAPVHAEGSSGITEAPPFHVTVPTRPMAVKQVTPQVPPDAQIGSYGTGSLCLSRVPVTVDRLFEKDPTRSYARAFATEAGVAGYAVAGPSLFGRGARIRPELEVDAAITALSLGGCVHSSRKGDIFSGNAVITVTTTVDWQVFDARQKKLLFRQSTQGRGDGSGSKALTEAARVAFENAARQVLAEPTFLVAVQKAGQ